MIFDYAYYRFCRFYIKDSESSARITSLALLSLIQTLNIFSVIVVFGLYKYFLSNVKVAVLVTYVTLLILNGIYYNKHNYDVLAEKWKNEDESTQRRKGFYVQAYVGLSLLLIIGLIFR
jgi:amino acid permease